MTIPAHTRRQHLLGTVGLLTTACSAARRAAPAAPAASATASESVAAIEARVGGRVGVFALDTGTGRTLAHRPDERFAMCSTFKWVLAAAVLARVDRRDLTLSEPVPYTSADLLAYAPVAREHVAAGALSVGALAEAAVTLSDNTAANLLLARIGGPAGITQLARAAGDSVTRLDRVEPDLNENAAGDPRDTTSPRAMVGLMRSVLCGDVLSPGSRERLLGWMRACETGRRRLRAGFAPDWIVGDKTGTGSHNAVNDVAIAVPPGHPPLLVAAYLSGSTSEMSALEAAHAQIARLAARDLTG